MFGCCVAGRLLQTNLQQIDDTNAAFELPAAGSINHICVFLLGTVPFPEGYGATVHFFWPGRGFQLLGMLSNDKPSAIFRLRGTFTSPTSSTQPAHPHAFLSSTPPAGASDDVTAILGLSIEPLDQIYARTGALAKTGAAPSSSTTSTLVPAGAAVPPDASLLAERVARHLVNYVSGFVSSSGSPASGMDMDTSAGAGAGTRGGAGGAGGPVRPESAVPLGLIARWYEGFVVKVRAGGVGFLERVE
ncbi:hypothetical protein HETIRDRAFT_421266 [Heterobasidion irregulare TC 32-1]|uniref:Uncharacterized protein n=1 Tax=Heterobasidion irregulare (strain TC 32-1) TaxID=747525 RepID=W4JUE2_HETIT|nr:uncharacterized protein HETIRDRAFT_421266 [Heterobasidion irregulare TC 32-1]ETW77084.1 hypothetical protein HETIRDRAFT_421266 [Heterobasidion irregulare TC 32-1]